MFADLKANNSKSNRCFANSSTYNGIIDTELQIASTYGLAQTDFLAFPFPFLFNHKLIVCDQEGILNKMKSIFTYELQLVLLPCDGSMEKSIAG